METNTKIQLLSVDQNHLIIALSRVIDMLRHECTCISFSLKMIQHGTVNCPLNPKRTIWKVVLMDEFDALSIQLTLGANYSRFLLFLAQCMTL